MMTKDILSHDWHALRGKMRERWHSLSDQDIQNIDGNYDVLVSMLQEKYTYGRQTAEHEVEQFVHEFAGSPQSIH